MRPFEPLAWDELPDTARALLPADAPAATRLMAARSLLPMGTRDLVSVLYYLSGDEEKRGRAVARRSLTNLPADLLATVLSERLSPKILHWFANRPLPDLRLYETLALNRATDDETIALLAAVRYEDRLLNIIANNQERLLRYPGIARSLINNEAAAVGLIERVKSFIEVTLGRPVEEFVRDAVDAAPPVADAAEAPAAPPEAAPAPLETEPETAPVEPAEAGAPVGGEPADGGQAAAYEAIGDDELPPDFDLDKFAREVLASDEKFDAEFMVDPEEALQTQAVGNLANRLRALPVLDKIRLAMKGNMEVRQFFIKSSNKLVQESVLRNTRITVEEVIKVASDKTMREELIRVVTGNKEWVKNYAVIHALCWNPKTPLTQAIKYLDRLSLKDLQHLSKSKQVPGLLAVQARKSHEEKQRYR
jgi:hypothetical protein